MGKVDFNAMENNGPGGVKYTGLDEHGDKACKKGLNIPADSGMVQMERLGFPSRRVSLFEAVCKNCAHTHTRADSSLRLEVGAGVPRGDQSIEFFRIRFILSCETAY